MAGLLPDPSTPPQLIPRPATAYPGAPAPWGARSGAERTRITLDRVTKALAARGQDGAPPDDLAARGPGSQLFDATTIGEPRASAVLVALFEEAGETRAIFTRRNPKLRAHAGEVSFPGGRLDTDEVALSGALREAEEEVALDADLVHVVGWLHPVVTFVSGSLIMPVVATLDRRPALDANLDEVERVFDVSLAELAREEVFHEERWSFPGRVVPGSSDNSFPVWFFEVAGEIIWGATARMVHELLAVVFDVPGL